MPMRTKETRENFQSGLMVLDYKQPQRLPVNSGFSDRSCYSCGRKSSCRGKLEDKGCAKSPAWTLGPDRSAMEIDDCLGDGQTESQTVETCHWLTFLLAESIEDKG